MWYLNNLKTKMKLINSAFHLFIAHINNCNNKVIRTKTWRKVWNNTKRQNTVLTFRFSPSDERYEGGRQTWSWNKLNYEGRTLQFRDNETAHVCMQHAFNVTYLNLICVWLLFGGGLQFFCTMHWNICINKFIIS